MNGEQSFGQVVKARRRELGLTQDELARRVGCAPVTIRKIEYDDLRPSVQIAERLAMALNIPLEERAAFVRLARVERAPLVEPTPTPSPKPEEIGTEDLTGRAIRGYALGERIGAGGFGAVYRAMQPLVEREVAVKIILPQYANHPEFIRRFEAEAQLVARLEHPHIVPLYDYWREPSVAFLVMRLLRGGSLRHLLESGPLPLEMALRMMEQVGAALGAAHRAGVIHRDLKPANVLLDEDQNAYLADFGIAKNLGNPNLEDQTQVDAIVGSPAYISPEQIRSEFVRPQTDIYCLGVVLYELLTGHLPFYGPTPIEVLHQHLSAPLPPLAARRTGLPGALDAVIERATAKDPLERYPEVDSLLADLRRAMGGVETTRRVVSTAVPELPPLTAADNPYKGLRAFGEGDAHDFFGREALIQQLLVRLGEGGDLSRFLAVVGPSGSGKSSVVGAGLVPSLRRGGLPGSDHWFIVEMLPGPHPLEELEAALLRIAVNPPATLLDQLRSDKRGLLRAAHRCLPDDPAVELVLVIDQFEEVFTLVPAEREAMRAHLLDSLVTAALDERSRVRIVITLRADFTDRPLNYVDFGELLRQRNEFVLPLTPDELEHAIVGPAERVGLQLETGLVAAIMHDVGDQPGALPLLQYALTELFEKCIVETRHGASPQSRTLTKAAYQSIGGVRGALGRRAEEVFAGLDEAGQETARQLFLRLVTLGEGTEDTRRRVLRSELESLAGMAPTPALPRSQKARTGEEDDSPSPVGALTDGGRGRGMGVVLEAFGKHRLLSFDRDPLTRGPTVELAHEALLREWPRLREWLNDSRADMRLQRQLATAAAEWQGANRDASFLLTGARLEQFEGWAAGTLVALTHDERAYLEASIAERERTQAEEAERQRRELEAARKLAETERARAESERQRAEEQVRYVSRVRLRNRVIAAAGAVALVLAVLAGIFGLQSSRNATEAGQNAATATVALGESQLRGTQAAQQAQLALNAQATAQAEAVIRATAQADAEEQADLSFSRELVAAAVSNLKVDPELSILLALESIGVKPSGAAEAILHEGIYDLHRRDRVVAHTDAVYGLAVSPDGKRLASASHDGTIKVWAIEGSQIFGDKPVLVIDDPVDFRVRRDGSAYSVTFSPDGTRLAAVSDQMTAKVWDAQTGELLLTFSGHAGNVYSVAFSPDGGSLATASADGTARLWDAATGEELLTLRGHQGAVLTALFSPDGKRLVTSSDADYTVRLWEIEGSAGAPSGTQLAVLEDTNQIGSTPAVFSPDGKRLAVGRARNIQIWEVDALVSGLASQSPLIIPSDGSWAKVLLFSPDGKRLISGTDDGHLTVWDAFAGSPYLELYPIEANIASGAIAPDGKTLFSATIFHDFMSWDISVAGNPEWIRVPAIVLALSPDGEIITSDWSQEPAKLSWWKVVDSQATEVRSFPLDHGSANYQAISPDLTRYVAVGCCGRDRQARIWDTRDGRLLNSIPLTDVYSVWGVSFSPDGKRLVTSNELTASGGGNAQVWDVGSGDLLLTLSGHTQRVHTANYSQDGKLIATSSRDFTARIWDAATGQLLHTLEGHTAAVWHASFTPDGRYLVTTSGDNTIKIWDVQTGQEVRSWLSPDAVFYPAFSSDGTILVVTNESDTAILYDFATGQELSRLPGASQPIFSPNGRGLLIVDGGYEFTYGFYLDRDELMKAARAQVTRSLTEQECQQYLHVEKCPGD